MGEEDKVENQERKEAWAGWKLKDAAEIKQHRRGAAPGGKAASRQAEEGGGNHIEDEMEKLLRRSPVRDTLRETGSARVDSPSAAGDVDEAGDVHFWNVEDKWKAGGAVLWLGGEVAVSSPDLQHHEGRQFLDHERLQDRLVENDGGIGIIHCAQRYGTDAGMSMVDEHVRQRNGGSNDY